VGCGGRIKVTSRQFKTGVPRYLTTSALPYSLAYSSRPEWWNDDDFTGNWPPVDPAAPVFSPDIIPAGARYLKSP
jgi:hypothetical protein